MRNRRPGPGFRRRHPDGPATDAADPGARRCGDRVGGLREQHGQWVVVGRIVAGPYPGDRSNGPDVLEQNGIVRSDLLHRRGGPDEPRADHHGPRQRRRAVRGGGRVYVWHCDRDGSYSMYSQGIEDQNYLRACRSPMPAESSSSPASSRPAAADDDRTSTSRYTPTRPASPTPRIPPRRRRSPCRRRPATRYTRNPAMRPR